MILEEVKYRRVEFVNELEVESASSLQGVRTMVLRNSLPDANRLSVNKVSASSMRYSMLCHLAFAIFTGGPQFPEITHSSTLRAFGEESARTCSGIPRGVPRTGYI